MFTGIVEAVGAIRAARPGEGGTKLWIDCSFRDLALGESVCVSGACLTVVASDSGGFETDVSAETLRRTRLGTLVAGARVNLERSLRLGDRLGGHMVFGHVDGMGRLMAVEPEGASALYRFEAPPGVARYLVEKGSVTVDGVSLTVFACQGAEFTVAVIPHTAQATTLGDLRPGDSVNLESDMIARYVEKLVTDRPRISSDP